MSQQVIDRKIQCTFFYNAPFGVLKIQLKNNKIYCVSKANISWSKVRRLSHSSVQIRQDKRGKMLIKKIVFFFDNYFSKDKKALNQSLPLFFRGTVFQKKVWRYLKKIPYGNTKTYAEVAKAIGSAGAARAVGSACAKNPYLILVPCHRVVAQKGLGGFALGLSVKKILLNHEKVL